MRFTTDEIAELTGGARHGRRVTVTGATQDSRLVEPGMLFVPLVAERDGHEFIGAAIEAGAVAYLTERPCEADDPAVVVEDTARALGDLARAGRRRLTGPVVGITGSVGKTSTKDLLAGVLRRSMTTHSSRRSFNNEIGVPLTLLNAPDDTEVAVVEMGSRGIGHIRALCDIAAPTIGVVTTIAGAHTGEFGSIEKIAEAKGELVEALGQDGLAVLNADVALCAALRSRTDADVLTFGRSADADVRFRGLTVDRELRVRFTIEGPWGTFEVEPATRGAHLAPNATAAAAVALRVGSTIEDVQAGLAEAQLSPWRMELGRHRSGAAIINDSYNANPTSMRGALESLAAIPGGRKVAVLGYMAELGPDEAADHRSIADYATELGVEVIAVGTELYGLPVSDDVIVDIGELDRDDAVLVKASRAAGLESVAERLTAA